MPSIRVSATFNEGYGTAIISATVEQSVVELSEEIRLRNGSSAEVELARRIMKDQLAVIDIELARQFDVLRAGARERERAEAEAEQARKDERAGQPDDAMPFA